MKMKMRKMKDNTLLIKDEDFELTLSEVQLLLMSIDNYTNKYINSYLCNFLTAKELNKFYGMVTDLLAIENKLSASFKKQFRRPEEKKENIEPRKVYIVHRIDINKGFRIFNSHDLASEFIGYQGNEAYLYRIKELDVINSITKDEAIDLSVFRVIF